MSFSPQYLTLDQVKIFLYGKVDFGDDPVISMTDAFLGTLISFAESEVERRLNRFYAIPFTSNDPTKDYTDLPQTTRAYLEELMILLSVVKVLEVDFALRGTNIAEDYKQMILQQYMMKMNSNFKRDETGRFLPPLTDLLINQLNYTGLTVMPRPMVVDQFQSAGDSLVYAVNQITKPWMSWWQFFPYGQTTGINNATN